MCTLEIKAVYCDLAISETGTTLVRILLANIYEFCLFSIHRASCFSLPRKSPCHPLVDCVYVMRACMSLGRYVFLQIFPTCPVCCHIFTTSTPWRRTSCPLYREPELYSLSVFLERGEAGRKNKIHINLIAVILRKTWQTKRKPENFSLPTPHIDGRCNRERNNN